MSDPVKDFAAHLASLTDSDARARALSQARLLGLSDAPPEAFKAPIRTLGDYLAADIEMPPVLIEPFICVRGGLNVTVGRAGKGKTVMNLNRMLRWSAGLPWLEGWVDKDGNPLLAPTQPLKILVVENEGAAGMFHRQIGLMLEAERFLSKEMKAVAKENMLIWGEGGYSGMKLDDATKLNELRSGVDEWKPDLVFIEPFRSLWNGEENSATDMNVVTDALVSIATDFNCGVWAAHHEKKGGHGEDDKMSAARGSTVLEGVVTVMENFEVAKGGALREVSYSKSRHEKAPNPVRLDWKADEWWYEWVPSEQIEEEILDALRENDSEPMGVADLHEALDESKDKIRKVANEMAKDGKLKKMPSVSMGGAGSTGPRYRLPTSEASEYGGLAI